MSNVKEDAKNKCRKLEGAMDEELEISCPPSPKNDAKTDRQDEQSSNYELGKDMWRQLARVSICLVETSVLMGAGERHLWLVLTRPQLQRCTNYCS